MTTRAMPRQAQQFLVFVSSPPDVMKERGWLSLIVEELSRIHSPRSVKLGLLGREIAPPDAMLPSEAIVQQRGTMNGTVDYDVFIGILWRRFGTLVQGSGTELEFRTAYARYRETGRPRVMLYFNRRPYLLHNSDEWEQLGRVMRFREDLQEQCFIKEYHGSEDFRRLVRKHLSQLVQDLRAEPRKRRVSPSSPEASSPSESEAVSELQRMQGFVAEATQAINKERDGSVFDAAKGERIAHALREAVNRVRIRAQQLRFDAGIRNLDDQVYDAERALNHLKRLLTDVSQIRLLKDGFVPGMQAARPNASPRDVASA